MATIRLCLGILLALAAGIAAASSVQLQNVRVSADPDNTRVVLGMASPFEYEIFTLDAPARVVIDIPAGQVADALPGAFGGEGVVKRIRMGVHDDYLRVVLDLAREIDPQSFTLTPQDNRGYRLVVDLATEGPPPSEPMVSRSESPTTARQSQPEPTVKSADFTRDELVIVVDAGHGGQDPGAIGPRGTMEKEVVLGIARRLASMIDAQPGMRAVMTRKGDYFLTLRQRIRVAQKADADLFVSIHANAARVGAADGSSVYVLSRDGATSEHARWLAHRENRAGLMGGISLDKKSRALASFMLDLAQGASIEASLDVGARVLQQLSQINDLHKHSVQQAAFVVLKSPDIPSILVETAFISNPREARKLQSPNFQRKLARSVLQGIHGYFASYRPVGPLMAKRKHAVSRGETLSEIALHYGVSPAAIRRANDLASSTIRVGQTLVIPRNYQSRVAAIGQ